MLTQISLQLAVDWHKSFSHLQGYQKPEMVVDTAKIFMAYLQSDSVDSAKTSNRNPSKSGNS